MRRRTAALVALLGAGAAVGLALWIHADLRGERRDEAAFVVAPLPSPPAGDAPATFAVWGDARGGADVLAAVVEGIARDRPAFSVGCGDLVGMARVHQFEILKARLSRTGAPAFFVPGNHDLDPFDTLKPYERVLGPRNWSFERGGALFVGFDSSHKVPALADVTWVQTAVRGRSPAAKAVVLFTHRPLFPPAERPDKGTAADAIGTRFLRALAEETRATVFSGDYHGFADHRVGAARQVVSGGAGSKLEMDVPHHFLLARVVGDGVEIERRDVGKASDFSQVADRLITFRDEGLWALRAFPVRTGLAIAGAVAALVGLVLLVLPRRQRRTGTGKSM
jgi:hypothetical protein